MVSHDFIVIIPARYASTRLPAKLLQDIHGKSVLQRVYEQVARSQATRIIIATDDSRIEQAAQGFGAEVCLTAATHESGTQRIAEVIEHQAISDDTIVVNVQGDEPFMPVSCIQHVAELLAHHPEAVMATLATPLSNAEQLFDPNVVKVVTDQQQHALYFSRATIPWDRQAYGDGTPSIQPAQLAQTLRHIGLYAYRAGFIRDYVQKPASPIEQIELLEQLRVLWYGHRIMVGLAEDIPGPGIDTAEDLQRAILYYSAQDQD